MCNSREALFNLQRSDFSNIKKVHDQFRPHLDLWTLAREYFRKKSTWMEGPLTELDGEDVPRVILEANKSLLKLQKGPFREAVYTSKICNELRILYSEFRPFLPIITALKNIDFKKRHFEEVVKLRDPPFEIEHDLS